MFMANSFGRSDNVFVIDGKLCLDYMHVQNRPLLSKITMDGPFICALWSPAGKGLTSWLSFVVYNCEFVIFPLVSSVRCGT